MKITFTILAFFIYSITVPDIAFGQIASEEPYSVIESNSSGEVSSASIDVMRSVIGDERLFVIVHLGTGETNRLINEMRLVNTKRFMFGKGFDQKTSVFAEGESVKGEGRIEFYIGSRKHLVILALRGKMPNLTCCEDYTPPAK